MAAAGLAAVLVLGACGSDDDATEDTTATTGAADSTTTTAAPEPLRILVSNDDGYQAEGIDALVQGLLTLDDVEVTVYAPLDQRSMTGEQSTPGDQPTSDVELQSGYPAVAVDGFPVDTVEVALAELPEPPDLVVTGINEGQNIGQPIIDISGTVAAARTGARAGIPALAVGGGQSDDDPVPDYASAVDLVLDWVTEHRDQLEPSTGTAPVANLNVPVCPPGELGDLLEVPVATAEQAHGSIYAIDCAAGPDADVSTDFSAFLAGHPALSELTA
jgi:5'-nucleotidase